MDFFSGHVRGAVLGLKRPIARTNKVAGTEYTLRDDSSRPTLAGVRISCAGMVSFSTLFHAQWSKDALTLLSRIIKRPGSFVVWAVSVPHDLFPPFLQHHPTIIATAPSVN